MPQGQPAQVRGELHLQLDRIPFPRGTFQNSRRVGITRIPAPPTLVRTNLGFGSITRESRDCRSRSRAAGYQLIEA